MSKTLKDFSCISVNLEGLVEELVKTYTYKGEDSNQDPCFTSSEAGFEKCLWNKDNSLEIGYMVIFTFDQENEEIKVNVYSFTYNDEEEEILKDLWLQFPLDITLKTINEELTKSIEKVLAKP